MKVSLPIVIAAGFLAWFIASWLITTLGWTLILGLVLWGAIALGVLHKAGKLGGHPWLKEPLDQLIAPRGAATPMSPATPTSAGTAAASKPSPKVPPRSPEVPPRDTAEVGVQRINALYGLETAKQQLDGLLTVATAARAQGQPGFGFRAPATMLVFQGPAGTGKTEMAIAYLHILYGAGIIPSDSFFKLASAQIADQRAGSANMVARQAAEAALDGVLIIENAEWMVGGTGMGDSRFAAEVGRGLMEVIARYPQRLIIVATGGPSLRRRLNGDADLRRELLNKIHLEDVDFDELSTDTLVRIFHDHAQAQQVRVARDMHNRLPTLIHALKRDEGEHFDNAHAIRRWFDRVYSQARRRDGQAPFIELTAEDFRLEAA